MLFLMPMLRGVGNFIGFPLTFPIVMALTPQIKDPVRVGAISKFYQFHLIHSGTREMTTGWIFGFSGPTVSQTLTKISVTALVSYPPLSWGYEDDASSLSEMLILMLSPTCLELSGFCFPQCSVTWVSGQRPLGKVRIVVTIFACNGIARPPGNWPPLQSVDFNLKTWSGLELGRESWLYWSNLPSATRFSILDFFCWYKLSSTFVCYPFICT